jgi:transcriptional regulator with XRE-family HTH domain
VSSPLATAIRNARRQAGLTQAQLGLRLGLKGRAVYRWENAQSAPSRRHARALVAAIRAVNLEAGSALDAAIDAARPQKATPVVVAPAVAAPAPISKPVEFERALFLLADELDLPARRLRGAVLRFVKRLRLASLSGEETEQLLEAWIANAP